MMRCKNKFLHQTRFCTKNTIFFLKHCFIIVLQSSVRKNFMLFHIFSSKMWCFYKVKQGAINFFCDTVFSIK